MQTTYIEPDLTLDYTGGLDRFGRIVDHAWTNATGEDVDTDEEEPLAS